MLIAGGPKLVQKIRHIEESLHRDFIISEGLRYTRPQSCTREYQAKRLNPPKVIPLKLFLDSRYLFSRE